MSSKDKPDHESNPKTKPPEGADPAVGHEAGQDAGQQADPEQSSNVEPKAADPVAEPARKPERESANDSQPEAAASKPKAQADPAPRSGGALAGLSLLLSLAAALGSAWVWWQWQNYSPPAVEVPELPDAAQFNADIDRRIADRSQPLREAVDSLRDDLESRITASEQRLMDRLRDETDRMVRRVEDVQASRRNDQVGVERRMEMVEGAVARLSQEGLSSERGLGVVEAEFLMRMAGERLTLFADSRGALRALELADAQLRALDDPIYTGVRQALAGEIEALRAVELPDRVAVSGRLLRLATASPEWPLDARRSLGAESPNLLQPEASEQGWWARAKEVMSNIVVVHRENPDEMVLLTLEEERLLRENVQLQLQVAQLAAVRGEQGLYGSAIALVRDWLDRYYEADSVNVTEALKSLDELAGLDLNPDLPDISAGLTRLRNLKATSAIDEGAP